MAKTIGNNSSYNSYIWNQTNVNGVLGSVFKAPENGKIIRINLCTGGKGPKGSGNAYCRGGVWEWNGNGQNAYNVAQTGVINTNEYYGPRSYDVTSDRNNKIKKGQLYFIGIYRANNSANVKMHYGVTRVAGWNSDVGENWYVYRRGSLSVPWSVSQNDVNNGCPTIVTDGVFKGDSGSVNYKMAISIDYEDDTGIVKRWTGHGWEKLPTVKRGDGTRCAIKKWNGSSWQTI